MSKEIIVAENNFDEELRQDLQAFHTKMNVLFQTLTDYVEEKEKASQQKDILAPIKGGKNA